MPRWFHSHVFCAALVCSDYKEHSPTQVSRSTGELLIRVHVQEKEARDLIGTQGGRFIGTWPLGPENGQGWLFHLCTFHGLCALSLWGLHSICSTFSSLRQPTCFSCSRFLLPHDIRTHVASTGCFPHSTWHRLSLCLCVKLTYHLRTLSCSWEKDMASFPFQY